MTDDSLLIANRSLRARRIVLTGGPGSGKTVISTRIAQMHPEKFVLVPEAATQVYDSLQTRWDKLDIEGRRDVQRKIYRLQVDQEDRTAQSNPGKILLLDRGTIDGAAYWPEGPEDYWRDVGSNLDTELKRCTGMRLPGNGSRIEPDPLGLARVEPVS